MRRVRNIIEYLNLHRLHEKIKKELKESIASVMDNEWYILGDKLEEFEENYAKYIGVRYCVGVGNGLDALHIILSSLGIGSGDEVIVPAHTFIATALAVNYVGAVPVFVDVDLNGLIDDNKIEKKITKKTKAIIGVHLYGRLVNVKKLKEIAERNNIYFVEDAAQAHGAEEKESLKKAGSFGIAAGFSFYPGKNLGALGDGGAITTNSLEVYKKAKALRNYGAEKKYYHEYYGVNSRLDEIQAAVLGNKLKYLDIWNSERRRIAEFYVNQINNSKIRLPELTGKENVWHIFPIYLEEREKLKKYLLDNGVQTLCHYPVPIHMQNAYAQLNYKKGDFPIAEKIAETELSLPIWPGMNEHEVMSICRIINNF